MSTLVQLDKSGDEPFYKQIYTQLKRCIIAGDLNPGDKLPSIRLLAGELHIARNTVDAAYRQLLVEGFVESRRGSGFTVASVQSGALRKAHSSENYNAPAEGSNPTFACDLRYGNLCPGSFPAEVWRRIMGEVVSSHYAAALSSYGNEFGERPLREQIAAYLMERRGVACNPDQVVLTSGTQQALELVCRLFDVRTDRVCMENPGFPLARLVFESLGFELCYASTVHGPARFLEDVAASGARLIYTTPSHQFPTGMCLDIGTRLELIATAEQNDAYIIEDNYDSEYRYDANPLPSLQSIDHAGRVIYVGTFSKTLSPALRLSYLVLPPDMVLSYRERFSRMRCTIPWAEQEAMRLFMERGLWDKHLHREYLSSRKRYDLLIKELGERFGNRVAISSGDAGLFVMVKVDAELSEAELVDRAAAAGVGVTPASTCWAAETQAPDDHVVLGFSAASADAVRDGVRRLQEAWIGSD